MRNIIDVSTHQGVIDWEKVKGQIDGVMIRCSAGHDGKCAHKDSGTDTQFIRNISECNRLGIPCGVYVMAYPLTDADARKEAEYCLNLIKPYRVELPVAWDFEYDSVNKAAEHGVIVTKEMATRWAHIFLETIEQAGYWATLYANMDYLTRYYAKGIEKRFDLWYCGWVSPEEATYNSKLSYPCGMWQYGCKQYDGIDGIVDSNFCYKNYPELLKLYGRNHLDKPVEIPEASYITLARECGFDVSDPTAAATKEDLWKLLEAVKKN